MNVLVTGGAGYIGSITCVQLVSAGFNPIILDSLVNSKLAAIDRMEEICGKRPTFIHGDVRDYALVEQTLRDHSIEAVIHFAGLKAVGESVSHPSLYYDCNVHGSLTLINAMRHAEVKTLVFSSSATVYGDALEMPLRETDPTAATNPYGRSKLMVEQIMTDIAISDSSWSMTALRYFNPVGAHPSGLMGEDPQGVPNNLMPYIAQVAVGRRPALQIFGNDYPTPDGTGVRDYIHVMDLAEGHISALQYGHGRAGSRTFNLGTGQGFSVLEMCHAFSLACGRELPYTFAPRRAGDVAASWADTSQANKHLNWQATHNVNRMCIDTWHWQSKNPQGYAS